MRKEIPYICQKCFVPNSDEGCSHYNPYLGGLACFKTDEYIKLTKGLMGNVIRIKTESSIKLQSYVCGECNFIIITSIERPQKCRCGNTIIAPVYAED